MSRSGEFQHGLSHEDWVSVAEQVMERAHLAGRTWHVPAMHHDDPSRVALHQPVHDYVHGVLSSAGVDPERVRQVRVQPKAWELREDKSQAATNGRDRIWLKGERTNDMTLLHEAAHILHGTSEGDAHGPAFVDTLEGLYRKHLGHEAADTFARVARPLR